MSALASYLNTPRRRLMAGAFAMAAGTAAVAPYAVEQIDLSRRMAAADAALKVDVCGAEGVCYGTVARSAMRAKDAPFLEDPVSLASPMGTSIMRDIAEPHGIPAKQVEQFLVAMDNNYSSIKEEVSTVAVGDVVKGGLLLIRPRQTLRNPSEEFNEQTNPYLMPIHRAMILVQKAGAKDCAGAYAITIEPGANEVRLTPTSVAIRASSHASDISAGGCRSLYEGVKAQMAVGAPSV